VRYEEMVAVLKVVHEHESATDEDAVCNPCDTAGLAQAVDLEPQEVADRLTAALARGRMITARKTSGATEPYYDQIRLSANGRAAVGHAEG
jgi:hypothetical protein